mmetsp:Transcript_4438/g.18018  ORF Transcript_4438/g.18018 Transcript_4438/m.18018 type:complete len:233 (-) Transcript_4438:415-1113(-)
MITAAARESRRARAGRRPDARTGHSVVGAARRQDRRGRRVFGELDRHGVEARRLDERDRLGAREHDDRVAAHEPAAFVGAQRGALPHDGPVVVVAARFVLALLVEEGVLAVGRVVDAARRVREDPRQVGRVARRDQGRVGVGRVGRRARVVRGGHLAAERRERDARVVDLARRVEDALDRPHVHLGKRERERLRDGRPRILLVVRRVDARLREHEHRALCGRGRLGGAGSRR